MKRVIIMPKGSEVRIAYLEPSTGLPVKEEWFGNDDNAPFVTNIYLFEEVIDPTGTVFTIHETISVDW